MRKIAITGTIAAGKSSLSILLKRRGFIVFNSDRYAKMAYRPSSSIYHEIVASFDNITDANNEIDPKKLAAVIFNDEKKRKQLNALIHPFVKQGIEAFFQRQKGSLFAFAEVPLLFEANMASHFDDIILVTCDKQTAMERMMKDRNYSYEEAKARYMAQDDKIDRTKCRFIIENNGTLQDLNDQVNQLLKTLRLESRQHA